MTRSTDLAPLVRPADVPPPGTVLPQHYPGCFGCGDLEGGLRVRVAMGEGLAVTAVFTVELHHQGAPGLVHGGVLASVFDEALGALQIYVGEPAVTANLSTDYVRPVPVGSVLHLSCRIDSREGRKLRVSGEAHLDAPDGPVVARAGALFVFVPLEHFTRHGSAAEVARLQDEPLRREVGP